MHRRQHDAQRLGVEHHRDLRARPSGARADRCGRSTAGRPRANASLLIGAVAIASIRACARRRRRGRSASYAARPASAEIRPQRESARSRPADAARKARSRRLAPGAGSAAALRAISGPMPAGSPTVMPIRGRPRHPHVPQLPDPHEPQPAARRPARSGCRRIRSRLRRRSRRASRPCRSAARSAGSTSGGRTCPDSFDGLRLRSCCFAILIETGSNVCRNVVQQSGRPHEP